jgi:preprotein translocase subunit SecF
MELIRPGTNYNIIGKRKLFVGVSAAFILISIVSLIVKGGPRYGIDFTGGTSAQVKFNTPAAPEDIRKAMEAAVTGQVVVQAVVGKSNEYIIQIEQMTTEVGAAGELIQSALEKAFGAGNVEIGAAQMVGPKAGKELRKSGLYAVMASWALILIYIWYRFEFVYGVGGVLALAHDTIVTVGAFSLLDKQIDLTIVAALLTLIGFSINDTVVVFDRIRENIKKEGGRGDLATIMNRSINETLSRTILTSGTVFLVVLALFFLGGSALHDFAFAMLVGVVVGTYSSVYVASPVVLWIHEYQKKRKATAAA